jgi:hypothetical protein
MWSAIHFPTMFFALAILIALVALADSINHTTAASLARIGRTFPWDHYRCGGAVLEHCTTFC